jgi:hypothetical protein
MTAPHSELHSRRADTGREVDVRIGRLSTLKLYFAKKQIAANSGHCLTFLPGDLGTFSTSSVYCVHLLGQSGISICMAYCHVVLRGADNHSTTVWLLSKYWYK